MECVKGYNWQNYRDYEWKHKKIHIKAKQTNKNWKISVWADYI